MSEATPRPIEPSTPSAEQLAQWRALVDRIRQGDRAEVVAWDEVAAARPVATYQVLVTQRVRQQLRDAPPTLVGYVAGIIAAPSGGSAPSRSSACGSRCTTPSTSSARL